MLNWLWLATALALAGGCVTVPANSRHRCRLDQFAAEPERDEILAVLEAAKRQARGVGQKAAGLPQLNDAPPNAEFYVTMAVAQEQAGDLDKAEEFYQKALARDPKSLLDAQRLCPFRRPAWAFGSGHEALQESAGQTSRRGQRLQRPGALLSASRACSTNRRPRFARRRSCSPSGRCITTISPPCWSMPSGTTRHWRNWWR